VHCGERGDEELDGDIMLNGKEKLFCCTMVAMSLAALYFTWSNNIAFFNQSENADFMGFVSGAFANPAASSFSWDLLFLTGVVCILMVQEAIRWKVRFVWLYIVLAMSIAISVVFPLFLIARQLRIAGERARNVTR
jgi:hypothetical protein